MNRRHFLASAASTALASTTLAMDSAPAFHSTPERVAVLELFTSEGCSSCPPAEVWFSKLNSAAGLWRQFIPMAFHVDYWDYLGWKDVLGSEANSQRQHQYAARWQSSSVYTPGFVLNGKEWREHELSLAKRETVGVLSLSNTGAGAWKLHFAPADGKAGPLVFHLAELGSVITKVTAGENTGRTLPHDFAVLNLISLSADGPSCELKLAADPRAKAIAAWISHGTDPTPLQAVGGWL